MAKLIALAHISTDNGFTTYRPGDELPAADMGRALLWLQSGAAKLVEDDYTPPARVAARLATAEPGQFGTATGGEATPDPLVGKVPMTEERRRQRWTR